MPEEKRPSPEEMEALKEKIKNMSPEELKEFQKKQCIFCQIVEGKIQAKKVYEDDKSIGILDINPANPGHILLLPKEHYSVMPQIPEKEVEHLFMVAKLLSNAVLKTLEASGTNIVVANGPAAGQRAQHFMIHVIPRKEGDGIEFTLPQKQHPEEGLKTVAEKVKQRLSGILKMKKEELVMKPKGALEAPAPIPIEKPMPKPIPKVEALKPAKVEPKMEAPKPAVEAVVKEEEKPKKKRRKKKKEAAPQINVIVKPGAEVKVEAKGAKITKEKPKKTSKKSKSKKEKKPEEKEEQKQEKEKKKEPKEKPPKESQEEKVTLDDITKVLGI